MGKGKHSNEKFENSSELRKKLKKTGKPARKTALAAKALRKIKAWKKGAIPEPDVEGSTEKISSVEKRKRKKRKHSKESFSESLDGQIGDNEDKNSDPLDGFVEDEPEDEDEVLSDQDTDGEGQRTFEGRCTTAKSGKSRDDMSPGEGQRTFEGRCTSVKTDRSRHDHEDGGQIQRTSSKSDKASVDKKFGKGQRPKGQSPNQGHRPISTFDQSSVDQNSQSDTDSVDTDTLIARIVK